MTIQLPDGRLLSDAVLDALRLRALHGRERGFTETQLADLLGVTRETICRWWSAFCHGGIDALPEPRSGRPVGSGRLLSAEQARQIQTLIDDHQPKDFGIACPLWTRQAVAELIHKEMGVTLAERTVGAYVRRWGYTPQRPARKGRKQDPEEVHRWLEETYPAVVQRAAAEGADIYWGDEFGIDRDTYRGRGYARPGQTPHREVSGRHGRVSGVAAINNQGEAHFLTYTGTLDAALFIVFLGLLLEETNKKLFLVLDNVRVHDSAAVAAWVAQRSPWLELIPLPRYTPERNPVEYLNNDVKTEVNAAGAPPDQEGLHANLDKFLGQLASWPERISSYFRHPAVQYAANPT